MMCGCRFINVKKCTSVVWDVRMGEAVWGGGSGLEGDRGRQVNMVGTEGSKEQKHSTQGALGFGRKQDP